MPGNAMERDQHMKKYAIALAAIFVLAVACGSAGTPEQVVQKFLDAWNNGDGDGVVSCMSSESLIELDGFIEILRVAPDESVAQLAMMGLEFTPEEVADLTAGQFFTAMLTSEAGSAEMPDLSNVVIGETTISEDGQSAIVNITADGEEEELELLLEDGSWKISKTPE